MNRNAVAISSSVLFVLLAAVLVLVPAPYVTWRPGEPVDVLATTDDQPVIAVEGVETHEVTGKLFMTLVSTSKADATVSLPEAMFVYYATGSDAMPRDLIYPPGKSEEEITREAVASMDTSRNNAIVAALRAAGIPVTERPMISSVVVSGPAGGILEPGDLILEVNGKPVDSTTAVADAVGATQVGSVVEFRVLRGGAERRLDVSTTPSSQDPARAIIGAGLSVGYEYGPRVTYGVSEEIVGPSAGLVFALGIYDKVTPGPLLGDLSVAGTGEIDPSGQVRAIGGIQEKLTGAQDAGATVFLLPRDNCEDVSDFTTDMRLVPVSTLRDAIAAVQYIQEGNEAEVSTCE
ncbi:PDZ domain-containing protein [uncultured Tessaracoccus sp.]|uniref:YlbL family protein n=1 Tax=uncultured Tessaracoccus sp. TaxID=905023 RepID=UPI0025ED5433|nr:S16 family serine protease [uncultured Tessaracoccus sp.]